MRWLPRELHDTNRPSATAQAVTLYRALELYRPPAQRIVSDEFAQLFLIPADQWRGQQAGKGEVVARLNCELDRREEVLDDERFMKGSRRTGVPHRGHG